MELVPSLLRNTTRSIFAGRFGSGKTEVAINFALKWITETDNTPMERRPVLVDLDIVTPYFRSREVAARLVERGLRLATPAAVGQFLDTPSITPQILGILQQDERPVIVDVGGDEQGARALSQYSQELRERGYAMYMVINPFRPFTNDAEGIREAIQEIERTSRLLVTGLVSNPHMMQGTTREQFEAGHRVVEHASRLLGLPIVFVAAAQALGSEIEGVLPGHVPFLILERFFVMPWENDESAN